MKKKPPTQPPSGPYASERIPDSDAPVEAYEVYFDDVLLASRKEPWTFDDMMAEIKKAKKDGRLPADLEGDKR